MKIVIAGASIGGLLIAYNLGKKGHNVIVFEKNGFEELGYDWYDFVWSDFFKQLNIPEINIDYFIKNNMSFDIFNYSDIIKLNQKESEREYGISRRQLSQFLYKKAEQFSKIHLNKTINSIMLEDDKIIGIIVDGEKITADLVIDNLGINSCLRQQLPDCLNIEQKIQADSVMFAYRAIYDRNPDAELPVDDTKCYLRHLGENGISWVNLEKDDKVDVLIGRIGQLSSSDVEKALICLRKENPIIGDNIYSGGQIYLIPIRYPQTKIFCKGYVLIGDSAFMTVPLLGSGIYASVIAANILVEVLEKDGYKEEDLFKYQQRLYTKIGADFFEIDAIKQFLLNSNINKLLVLLKKGVVDKNDITNIYNAKPLRYSFKELINKGMKGLLHPVLLLQMLKLLIRINKIKNAVSKLPKEYNIKALSDWQQKIYKIFKYKFKQNQKL